MRIYVCVRVSRIYQDEVRRLVVGEKDWEVEEEGVRGGIYFSRHTKPVLQEFQHDSCAHVGRVETSED